MRPSGGFTLIETLVALVIGATVVLLAQRIFGGIADAAAQAKHVREASDGQANGRRALSRLFGSALIGTPNTVFDGDRERVTLSTWWSDARGWPARRRCTIGLDDGRLVVQGLESEPVLLADSVEAVVFEYLAALGAQAPWLTRFQSQLLLPEAVRLRVTRGDHADTFVFHLGARR